MLRGKLVKVEARRGFAFIERGLGKPNLFAHFTDLHGAIYADGTAGEPILCNRWKLKRADVPTLVEGQWVRYELGRSNDGRLKAGVWEVADSYDRAKVNCLPANGIGELGTVKSYNQKIGRAVFTKDSYELVTTWERGRHFVYDHGDVEKLQEPSPVRLSEGFAFQHQFACIPKIGDQVRFIIRDNGQIRLWGMESERLKLEREREAEARPVRDWKAVADDFKRRADIRSCLDSDETRKEA